MDGTIDFSLLPEIRGRFLEIDRQFITFAGVGRDGQAVGGVDLFIMQERLSKETFRLYMQACRELRALEAPDKPNTLKTE